METIIILALIFGLGFILGISISTTFHRAILREFLKEFGYDTPEKLRELHKKIADKLKDEPQDDRPLIRIKLEQHQGVIFAYREDDNTFIGQGTDRESLIASIMHRVKGVTIEITNGELLQKSHTQNG